MMTGEQVAAYVRLLSHQWEEGSIPADPRRISVILTDGARRYTAEEVESDLWPALSDCFEIDPNDGERFVNNRLAAERLQWIKDKRKHSNAGRAGGIASGKSRRSKGKRSNDRSTTVQRSLNDSRTISNDSRTISSSSSLSSSALPPTPLAGGSEGARDGRGEEGNPTATREQDIGEEQAAFERLAREYPAGGFLNEIKIQREFHDLWRSGQLPSMPEFFATLDAYKRSHRWRDEGGRYVPQCERWLAGGGWKRRPPTTSTNRPPVVKAGPSDAEIAAMSPADRDAYFESLGGAA